jgi:CheY-like chemotaxis protein/two-component sensor histidine kinase
LVDDLLDIERTSQGKFELHWQSVDLRAVVASALAAVRGIYAHKDHAYVVQADSSLTVRGDSARLEQVFVNLLSNAAKFTDPGGEIQVSVRQEGNQAVVEICDNGCGIPEALLPHIFEAFRQADTSLDRANGGLGLGLTIVQRLVAMHGGIVSACNNAAGGGTRLQVRLPSCVEGAGAEAADAGEEAKIWRGESEREGAVRILLVDDHADAARILAKLLFSRGYEVQVVHDGGAAVEKAREFRPQVLLLDIGLPGVDGYELVRLLRQDPSVGGALFVAVSGYAREEDRTRAKAAGFDHHFAKPVSLDALLEVLPKTKRAPSGRRRPLQGSSSS